MLEIFQADDTTPVDDLAFPNVQAGAQSDLVEIHIWNDQGGSGQLAANVLLAFQAEDPQRAGIFLASNLPPLDQLWGRIRISGFANPGDPSWSVGTTELAPWGAHRPLVVGDIPADCAVFIEAALATPSAAAPPAGSPLAYRFGVAAHVDEHSRPAPAHLAQLHRGVLAHNGDGTSSYLIDGGQLAASSTPG